MTSTLEELFAFQATAAGLPAFEWEVCVIPGRKFRFDFAWPAYKLLVEVNGGTFTNGSFSKRFIDVFADEGDILSCTLYKQTTAFLSPGRASGVELFTESVENLPSGEILRHGTGANSFTIKLDVSVKEVK